MQHMMYSWHGFFQTQSSPPSHQCLGGTCGAHANQSMQRTRDEAQRSGYSYGREPLISFVMRSAHVLLILMIALTGCMPVKQYHVTGGQQYDSFSYLDHLRCGLLQIGPSNIPKAFKIVDSESHAVSPDGKRVGISTEPHDYDLRPDKDPSAPYVRDRVYLVAADGKRVTRKWEDGLWEFHFVLDAPSGRETRDFEMQVSTFYYNPVVHGSPN